MPPKTVTSVTLHFGGGQELTVDGSEKDALFWGAPAIDLFLEYCPEYEGISDAFHDPDSGVVAACHEPGCLCCVEGLGTGVPKPPLLRVVLHLEDGGSVPVDPSERDALFWIADADGERSVDVFRNAYEGRGDCPDVEGMIAELEDPDSDVVALCHMYSCICCYVRHPPRPASKT